jgi:hypothetical protein
VAAVLLYVIHVWHCHRGSEHHRPKEFFARDKFLGSIRDRLGTAAVKGQALDLCQELFLADGARSDEEDAVLQNLKTLLE